MSHDLVDFLFDAGARECEACGLLVMPGQRCQCKRAKLHHQARPARKHRPARNTRPDPNQKAPR